MVRKTEQFFRNHPIFTRECFELAMGDGRSANANTVKNMLAQHIERGHIVRIRRGLFASIPRGADPKHYPINPFLIATALTDDAVIAYHSALSFYGVAYSFSYRIIYLTQQKPKSLRFRDETYQPSLFPTPLIKQGKTHCYVNKEDVQGMDIKVTSKERTLVDVMDRPLLGGGWEEIWRSLDRFEHLNMDVIIDYALILGNATTIAKVGFYLDQRKLSLKIDPKHLAILHQHSPTSPHYMVDSTKEKCQYVKYWNLMVPVSLVTREWEENLEWEPES